MLLIPALVLASAASASGRSFSPMPILKEEGIDVLNGSVARERLDRELFADPYATVVIGRVDVYEGFPYVEARTFQVVSDSEWNRLLFGELGRGVAAHDGTGSPFGPLRSPRGLAADERGRLYVADSGNHRVLVYDTWTEFDRMELRPVFSIEELRRPHDVAYSDGGTPFEPGDDRLYVADTGRNRVLSYELSSSTATPVAAIGELGAGPGFFAGPVALAVGRQDGASTADVYVADAHSERIVRLRDAGGSLTWIAAAPMRGVATSLDTDHWGNVYAAAPHAGRIAKFTASLEPLASLDSGVDRPRSFHVPFVAQHDHRNGSIKWLGQGVGILVEQWSASSGIRSVQLGIEINDLAVRTEGGLSAEFLLTDRGNVRSEILNASTSEVVHRLPDRTIEAGRQTLSFDAESVAPHLASGDYVLRLTASSTYDGQTAETAEARFEWRDGGVFGTEALLQASEPNPFRESTTFRFHNPTRGLVKLRVFDVSGRVVRTILEGSVEAGSHVATWDGRDDASGKVASGVYLYRLEAAGKTLTRKAVFLR
jgi:hypothetical protein